MPRLNRHGQIAEQRREWYDNTRTAFQDCSTGECKVVLSDGSVQADRGANFVYAGGGVWAAWLFQYGVFDSLGRHFPDAGLGPVGPDGAIALKPEFNSFGPWEVLEKSGQRWTLTPGDAYEIQLLGHQRALWQEQGFVKTTEGLPIRVPNERVWWPRAVEYRGQFLLLYQHQGTGALVLAGRKILPPGNYFYPDAAFIDGAFHIVWSPNQADTEAQRLVLTEIELSTYPFITSIDVTPPATPEPAKPEPPTMPEIPAALENQIGLVTEVRSTLYPDMVGKPLNDAKKAFAITKHVAWRLRQHGVGLVKAKQGSDNNVEGFTSDIVALANGVHWDVLVDGNEGAAFPNWAMEENPDNYPPIAARWVPAIDPGGSTKPEEPPTPPPTTCDCAAKIEALEKELSDLRKTLADGLLEIAEAADRVEARIEALEERKPALPKMRAKGRAQTSRSFGHSHGLDIDLEVTPE